MCVVLFDNCLINVPCILSSISPFLKYLINVRRAPRPRPLFIFPFIYGVCLLLNHPIAVWHILTQGYKFYLAKGYRVRPSHAPEYLVYASNSYRVVRSGIVDRSVPYSRYDFLEFFGENVNKSDEKLKKRQLTSI